MDVVSLFSGAGGLDLGFINRGHKILWANDFDKDSVATYRKNIGDHIVLGDICDISTDQIPDSDVIIGGFPCQGFSQANLRRAVDDPRNGLYREFLRVLNDKKPKFFVAENVRGLLSLDEGNAYRVITRGFEECGYKVVSKVLNAADYGVPQNRRRLIFLGVREDYQTAGELKHPEPTHGPAMPQAYVSAGAALANVPDPELFPRAVPNQVYSKYKLTIRNFTGHRATDPEKPSPTILARGNGGGGVTAIPHPEGHRRMSVRESATIQTFPENFEFVGSLGSAYRQVGNAVPVLLAEKIAEAIERAEIKNVIEEENVEI